MNFPIGTRFTRPELQDGEYWELRADGSHFIKNGESIYKNRYDSQSWIDLEYTIHYPKENLFDSLYKKMTQ